MAFQKSLFDYLPSLLKNLLVFRCRRAVALFLAVLYFMNSVLLCDFFAALKREFLFLIAKSTEFAVPCA